MSPGEHVAGDAAVRGGGVPRTPAQPGEVLRIAASMTITCVFGAAILGSVYLGTERYAERARAAREQSAIAELLSLGPEATVLTITQYLVPVRREVVYRFSDAGGPTELVFSYEGVLLRRTPAAGSEDAVPKGWIAAGRIHAAREGATPAGFVVESEAQGYKKRIRFFVALDSAFEIAGVRVLEHEEDPGLGAEIATTWFQAQFEGRTAASLPALDVTRDPMPEDWRAALADRDRTDPRSWRGRNASLIDRERTNPIYAVTGATISSRALTNGVRAAVRHFERRWALLSPHLGSGS